MGLLVSRAACTRLFRFSRLWRVAWIFQPMANELAKLENDVWQYSMPELNECLDFAIRATKSFSSEYR